MKNFGKAVVALRIPILIVSVLLLIPAALGYIRTRTNYDVLSYLPGEIETMIGQNILGEQNQQRMNEQLDLFDYRKTEILEELQALDVMALTPMDAINKLFLLREKARKL